MQIQSFTNPTQVYQTTATSCTCPDHQFRNRECKHMKWVIARQSSLDAITAAIQDERMRQYDVVAAAVQVVSDAVIGDAYEQMEKTTATERETAASYFRHSFDQY